MAVIAGFRQTDSLAGSATGLGASRSARAMEDQVSEKSNVLGEALPKSGQP